MTKQLKKIVALLFWLIPLPLLADFDHSQWSYLLEQHVKQIDGWGVTRVNYAGMLADRSSLRDYLDDLAEIDRGVFNSWPESDQLAFLINTYNAWTIELILTEYPDIDSIREFGFLFWSPWRRKSVSLFGEQVSLNDIEHRMIRGWDKYNEPRIHFAVNCAAIGCPALRAEAYEGYRLDQQLEDATRLFLSDRRRNYFANNQLFVSRIFYWYEEDFQQGWIGVNSVGEFLARYADVLDLDSGMATALMDGKLRIRHLRYDWRLNRTP